MQRAKVEDMSEKDIAREIKRLEKLMLEHARNLEFEQAARGARPAGHPEGAGFRRRGARQRGADPAWRTLKAERRTQLRD